MRTDIHPTWHDDCTVVCACGNTWTTGATVQEIRTDICSACHPFYTGEQRIVDTEGRVDVFIRRLQAREQMMAEAEQRRADRTPSDLPLTELGISTRYTNILAENGIVIVDDFLKKLTEDGEESILEFHGIGRKAIADMRKALRNRGYQLEAEAE